MWRMFRGSKSQARHREGLWTPPMLTDNVVLPPDGATWVALTVHGCEIAFVSVTSLSPSHTAFPCPGQCKYAPACSLQERSSHFLHKRDDLQPRQAFWQGFDSASAGRDFWPCLS